MDVHHVKQPIVFIGTSNVVVPGNKTTFPPAYRSGSRLKYYGSLFNSVEVNSSFYNTPMAATVARWSTEVPDEFQFSFKLSKEITHAKHLSSDWSSLAGFLQAINGAGSKKGCLLIQFPGKITIDYFDKVNLLLESLGETDLVSNWRIALEFRHPSWYIRETAELANEFKAAIVMHDIPKSRLTEVMSDTDFIYIRYHGPTGTYRDSYAIPFLKAEAQKIKKWRKEGKDVFVYFNNTIGAAFENARSLQDMVK